MKGPLARPMIPFGGPYACRPKVPGGFGATTCIKNRKEKICLHPDPFDPDEMNVRLADLAATYSPAS